MNVRILVVDDEQAICQVLKYTLEEAGYIVDMVPGGIEALRKLQNEDNNLRYRMLITDITMPAMTGVELIREIRKANIRIPILAISGFDNKELIEEFKDDGSVTYLDKPVLPSLLINHVKQVLDRVEKNNKNGST